MKRKILSVTLLLFVFSNKLLIAQAGMWTWMKGDSTCCSSGTWGIQGLSDASNNPPALYNPASWTDHDGNFWLFGGSKGNNTYSALWKFNVLTNEWTWINGSQLPNQCGVYGVIGVPSPDNSPGARGAALLSWTDTNGDLWLYGGYAFCSAIDGDRNDLWRYSISTNEWTWMDGSDSNVYLDPIYGNYQVPASDNNPGSLHENTAAWTDSLGNFWLYSGGNSSCIGTAMWKYDVGVNDWVWM